MFREVKPIVGLLIIIYMLPFAGFFYFSGDLKKGVLGPGLMHVDTKGRLYVESTGHLFRFDSEGSLEADLPLSKVGLTVLDGGFGVFGNGDVLLSTHSGRYGPVKRALFWLRGDEPVQNTPGFHGLMRCDMVTAKCRPFVKTGRAISGHRIFIDPVTEQVFLADSNSNAIRVFDSEGGMLAENEHDWSRPRGVVVSGAEVVVADSNFERVRVFSLQGGVLEEQTRLGRNGMPLQAREAGHHYPVDLLHAGDHWRVVVRGRDFWNTSIYRFDEGWRYQGRVALPEGVRAQGMAIWGDNFLVTDPLGRRILRLSLSGEQLTDFAEPALRQHYARLARDEAYLGIWVTIIRVSLVLVLVMFVVLAWKTARPVELPDAAAGASISPSEDELSDTGIVWIKPRPLFRGTSDRMVAVALLALMGLFLGLGVMAADARAIKATLVLILISGALVLLEYIQGRSRLGVQSSRLILRDYAGRTAAGEGAQIRYSSNSVSVGNVLVNYGSGNYQRFRQEDLVKKVYPLLVNATELTGAQASQLAFRLYRARAIALAVALLLGTGIIVVLLLA